MGAVAAPAPVAARAEEEKAEEPLPANWVKCTTKEGKVYYANKATKVSCIFGYFLVVGVFESDFGVLFGFVRVELGTLFLCFLWELSECWKGVFPVYCVLCTIVTVA